MTISAVAAMLAAISYEPLVRIGIGPFAISPHGIGTALGFAAGAWLMLPGMRRRGVDDDLFGVIATRSIIGGIVGARFFYVLNNLSSYDSVIEVLKVWEGGISLLGGLFGAILLSYPAVRGKGLRFLQVMDAAVPGVALGIAIGRVGDLVIADHLGAPTDLPFGFRCPDTVDVGRTVGSPCPPGEVVHLTALYDLVAVSVVLAIVLLYRRNRRVEGAVTLVAAMAYGTGRFAFDFLREDTRRLGLTGSQWVALGVLSVAAALFVRRRRAAGLPETPEGATPRPPGSDASRPPPATDSHDRSAT
ncbi:MAG: prolipoprotein diacylglyceryl transferase [Actinomycetota bacterium]|nr:prolipoprotein diacylglyceryl transferase [Actinomycetota bacterium]